MKQKWTKRIVAVLLSVTLLVSALPMAVFAEVLPPLNVEKYQDLTYTADGYGETFATGDTTTPYIELILGVDNGAQDEAKTFSKPFCSILFHNLEDLDETLSWFLGDYENVKEAIANQLTIPFDVKWIVKTLFKDNPEFANSIVDTLKRFGVDTDAKNFQFVIDEMPKNVGTYAVVAVPLEPQNYTTLAGLVAIKPADTKIKVYHQEEEGANFAYNMGEYQGDFDNNLRNSSPEVQLAAGVVDRVLDKVAGETPTKPIQKFAAAVKKAFDRFLSTAVIDYKDANDAEKGFKFGATIKDNTLTPVGNPDGTDEEKAAYKQYLVKQAAADAAAQKFVVDSYTYYEFGSKGPAKILQQKPADMQPGIYVETAATIGGNFASRMLTPRVFIILRKDAGLNITQKGNQLVVKLGDGTDPNPEDYTVAYSNWRGIYKEAPQGQDCLVTVSFRGDAAHKPATKTIVWKAVK